MTNEDKNTKTRSERYFLTLKNIAMREEKTDRIFAWTIVPHIEPFDESLEALQKQVDGYIEHFIISRELEMSGIDMWINEEGKFKGYHPTFALFNEDGSECCDAILGPCCFTRFDSEGYTHGLTKEDIDHIGRWLNSLRFIPISMSKDGALEYAFKVDGFKNQS